MARLERIESRGRKAGGLAEELRYRTTERMAVQRDQGNPPECRDDLLDILHKTAPRLLSSTSVAFLH